MCEFAFQKITSNRYGLDFYQIFTIPDEEYYSETAAGWNVSFYIKIIWCSR